MTTTNTNRAIYRVAMRQLDNATLLRFAECEPDLTPLEAELLARLRPLIAFDDLVNHYGDAEEVVKRLDDLEAIADVAGEDIPEIQRAARCLDFCRDLEGVNSPYQVLMRIRDGWCDEPPEHDLDDDTRRISDGDYQSIKNAVRDLDSGWYRAYCE